MLCASMSMRKLLGLRSELLTLGKRFGKILDFKVRLRLRLDFDQVLKLQITVYSITCDSMISVDLHVYGIFLKCSSVQ